MRQKKKELKMFFCALLKDERKEKQRLLEGGIVRIDVKRFEKALFRLLSPFCHCC